MPKKRTKRGKPDPAILADVVKRIVRAAKPDKIVLFGSAARGEMGPDSDLDLLVIKGGKFDRWRLHTRIIRHLRGKRAPVDVVIVTPEEVKRYRDTHCLVICPALKEGRVVYDSERLPANDPREWLNRARGNLVRARTPIRGGYLEDMCFDAQQCAEKAIKAVFVARGQRFPRIHDLEELLGLLGRTGLKIPKYVRESDELVPFAAVTRYPGPIDPVTPRQHRRAVRIAAAVLRWAERLIAPSVKARRQKK